MVDTSFNVNMVLVGDCRPSPATLSGEPLQFMPKTPSNVSPVLQFILLIVPLVMSGFYTVYSLVGVILEERDKYNWSLEAPEVALWVGGGISAYSVLVLLYASFKKLKPRHLLRISGWSHLILAISLTIAVFVIVRV